MLMWSWVASFVLLHYPDVSGRWGAVRSADVCEVGQSEGLDHSVDSRIIGFQELP